MFAYAYRRSQVVVTVNVSDFMALASGMEVHPGVIALREAELTAEEQWLRVQRALDFAEEHCGGDLLNQVLEVTLDTQLVLHRIPPQQGNP